MRTVRLRTFDEVLFRYLIVRFALEVLAPNEFFDMLLNVLIEYTAFAFLPFALKTDAFLFDFLYSCFGLNKYGATMH